MLGEGRHQARVDERGEEPDQRLAGVPIIIGTEDGSGALDVPRFPRPESWSDVLEAVDALTAKGHDYRTCVLDSLDWAEPMIWAHVCAASGKASIDDVNEELEAELPDEEWDTKMVAVSGHPVIVVRTPQGFRALSAICTHLGCIVKQTQEGFECPCHGSRFGGDGRGGCRAAGRCRGL